MRSTMTTLITDMVAQVESMRGRMSETERQAPCRACRDIEGLSPFGDAPGFESMLAKSFGGE